MYKCRDAEFWTCGFFPGSIYCLLERLRKYPGSSLARISAASSSQEFQVQLMFHLTDLCEKWSASIHPMSARTDTHDMGFIVQPALQRDWELFGRQASLDSLLHAATSLATRYDDRVQAIRSWDRFSNVNHNITSMDDDFLVIIDSLCSEYYAIYPIKQSSMLITLRSRSSFLRWKLHPEFPSSVHCMHTCHDPPQHTSPQRVCTRKSKCILNLPCSEFLAFQ